MKDRHSNSGDEAPATYDAEYWAHFLDDLEEDDWGAEGSHLISVDELRAAGALDVPPGWRTSLGVDRNPPSGLFADGALWTEEWASDSQDENRDADGEESPWHRVLLPRVQQEQPAIRERG